MGRVRRALSFGTTKASPRKWRRQCKEKLAELLGLELPVRPAVVRELRAAMIGEVRGTGGTGDSH